VTAIEAYLQQLEAALPGPRAARRRIVAEVEAHLRDAAQQGVLAGLQQPDAELEAVARFGAAETLARDFRQLLALRLLGRACLALVAGLALAAVAAAGLTENLLPPAAWPTDELPAALAWRRAAVAAALLLASVLGAGAWLTARAGHRRVAASVASGAAAASLATVALWISLALEWADRVPGAGEAFTAATGVAAGLLVPAAVLAAGALRAARGASAAG
jgi:hypothetical protein